MVSPHSVVNQTGAYGFRAIPRKRAEQHGRAARAKSWFGRGGVRVAKLTVTHYADGRPYAVVEGFGGVLNDFLFCEASHSKVVRYYLALMDQAAEGDGVIDWAGNVFLVRGDWGRVAVIEDEDIMRRPDHRCELPTPELRGLLAEWAAALEAHGR